jgi:hypothetical protein
VNEEALAHWGPLRQKKKFTKQPIPVATPSQVLICGLLIAGIVNSNPAGGIDVCLL